MLTFNDVTVKYGKKTILENISFHLQKGKITVVLGKNGCGKSTLVSCAASLLKYDGDIIFEGDKLSHLTPRERAKNISLLPQMLTPVPVTVEELVTMGRNPYVDLTGRLNEVDKQSIDSAIRLVGIESLRGTLVNRLSGGECRKAYIAMILAQDTKLVILDEPTAYMDAEYISAFSDIVLRLKNEFNKTLLIVSHDISTACDFADNVILIDDKRIIFNDSVTRFINSDLAERTFKVRRVEYCENGINKVLFR